MVAAAGPAVEEPSIWLQMVPLVMMLVILWLLIVMPSRKRQKEHDNMVNGLQKGDKVLTSGGILGEICAIDSNGLVTLEIADKVRIKILKSQVAGRFDPDKKAAGSISDKEEKKADTAASENK